MAQIENFSEWQNVLNSSAYQELQLAAGAEDISTPARLADWARRNGFKVVQKSNGEIVSFAQAANGVKNTQALEDIGSALNSNTTGTTAENIVNFTRPVNTKIEATEAGAKITTEELKGVTKAGNSVAIKAIGIASAALTGVSIGTALGNIIAKELYEAYPDYWNGLDPNKINYKDYFGPVIGEFYNLYFGVDENGNNQVYIRDDDFAAIALKLNQLGLFDTANVATVDDQSKFTYLKTPVSIAYKSIQPGQTIDIPMPGMAYYKLSNRTGAEGRFAIFLKPGDAYDSNANMFFARMDTKSFDAYHAFGIDYEREDGYKGYTNAGYQGSYTAVINGYGLVEASHGIGGYSTNESHLGVPVNSLNSLKPGHYKEYEIYAEAVYAMCAGKIGHIPTTPGVSHQEGAKIPDLGGISITAPDAVAQALAALKQQIPELWNNSIEIPTPPEFYPNGVPVEKPQLVPVPLPQPDPDGAPLPQPGPDGLPDPITGPATQAKPQIDPDAPYVPQTIDRIFPNPPVDPDPENPTPPSDETGTGMVPPIILPTGDAHALFTVYNPTQAQINDFGAWLWSSDPIDALMKMFQSPIEAVISLHQIYVDPPVGESQHIWCGYLDSGVSSLVVSKQYTSHDCGSISLPEYFGNVLDYSPYTEVSLYLPFIGIVPLADKDIMRSTISITYNVDVYTGACLANVKVTRDGGNGGVLYTFAGNCAVQYPLTSGNMNGLLLGLANTALAVTTGSPFLVGHAAVNAIAGGGSVQRSGHFSGNSGVLGNKTPYLIISRPQPHLANNFSAYQGKPTNYTTTVGACSGFIKCKVDHIENVNATDSELTEIDTLLQQGVLV